MSHSSDLPLDSHQLRVFATLAKTGSFTHAGRQLHLTQSAVSHSIRALEEATGCRLLDRVGKTAHPTPAGEQLLHHANRILQENVAARAALAHRTSWGKARLKVAVSPVLAEGRLAHAIRSFTRQLPGCTLTVDLVPESRAVEALLGGLADIAFGVAPSGEARIDARPVYVDELQWVVPEDHPWVNRGHVDRESIARQNLILPPHIDGTRALVDPYLAREGFPTAAHLEVASASLALRLVRKGAGITLLAPWCLGEVDPPVGIRTFAAGRRKLRRTWSAMRYLGVPSTHAGEVFIREFEASLGML